MAACDLERKKRMSAMRTYACVMSLVLFVAPPHFDVLFCTNFLMILSLQFDATRVR
jgi:hypothetical protein